jgi:arginase
MLDPDQILFFASVNSTAFERQVIADRGIAEVPLAEMVADPAGSARRVVDGWARRFERLLVHLDVDVVDYVDMPLAENYRRNRGLRFEQLKSALNPLLHAPNWVALTVTELNPDHGASDGSTLRTFVEALAGALPAG